jgi:hypothetical protein
VPHRRCQLKYQPSRQTVHDGEEIPDPGIIAIGKIDAGVEAFNVPGSVEVTIELVQPQ